MPKDVESGSALKNLINQSLLQKISKSISKVYPQFDHKTFVKLTSEMKSLEMKPRVRFVRDEIQKRLPQDYPQAVSILLKSTEDGTLRGFDIWPYTEFVQTFGLHHIELSLKALKKLTPLFTAEWAVQPFIKKHQIQTMEFLLKCAQDSDENVRRWASEGTRPRLPWGERLQSFIKDPSPTRPILELLKFDSSLYVRKSVANHLNDIAKDHPDYVVDLLQKWKKEAQTENQKRINWITRHALRTLIKNGNPKALKLIGVSPAIEVQISNLSIKKPSIQLGEKIEFTFKIRSSAAKSQKIVVDYRLHFVKANSKTSAKVFKLKTFKITPKEVLTIQKSHHIKKITTREYYSGRHLLEIQVNGKILGKIPWNLNLET